MEVPSPIDRSALPDRPSGSATYDAFLRRSGATGYLRIQAARANRALPTPGVRISVIGQFSDARVLFFDGLTDNDGIIGSVALPAPPRAASLQPQQPQRGAVYQVFAVHPDFAPAAYEVEIFEDITAILPVELRVQEEVSP